MTEKFESIAELDLKQFLSIPQSMLLSEVWDCKMFYLLNSIKFLKVWRCLSTFEFNREILSIHSSQIFYQGKEKIFSVLDSIAMISGRGFSTAWSKKNSS